jgi:protoheme IX farnesyltransferase
MTADAVKAPDRPPAAVRRTSGWLADVLVLTKARVNILVVATTFVGFTLHVPLAHRGLLLFNTLIGTGLVAAAAAVANQIRERGFDRQMVRTRHRPLADGRWRPVTAVGLGAVLLAVGCLWLGRFVNLLALGFAGLAFVIYVFAYTPLKRVTPACTLVGAVAGALPVLVGWAATDTPFGGWAFIAFAVLFFWQIPHFLAIAWWRRTEYQQAGFHVLHPSDRDGFQTARRALIFTMILLGVSFVPVIRRQVSAGYGPVALALGIGFSVFAIRFLARRNEAAARSFFLASLFYLPALYVLMLLGKGRHF